MYVCIYIYIYMYIAIVCVYIYIYMYMRLAITRTMASRSEHEAFGESGSPTQLCTSRAKHITIHKFGSDVSSIYH